MTSRRALTIIGAVFLVSALFVAIAIQLMRDRLDTERQAAVSIRNLAVALSQHTTQYFSAVDQFLVGIRADLTLLRDEDPALRDDYIHTILTSRRDISQGVFAFFILGPDGMLAHTSRSPEPEPRDFSRRSIFTGVRDRTTDTMFVEEPLIGMVGYAEGRRIVDVGRRLQTRDGSFEGVIAAAISVEAIEALQRSLDVGRDGAIRLFRTDGMLVAQTGGEPDAVGRSFAGHPLFAAWRETPASDETISGPDIDGVDRLYAAHPIGGTDLFLVIGLSWDEILAPWWERVRLAAYLAALALATALPLAIAWWRADRRQYRAAALAMRRLERLASLSADIASARTTQEVLARAAAGSRDILAAHQAVASLTSNDSFAQELAAVSLSDKYARWRDYGSHPDGSGIYRLVCETNRPMRLTQAELEAHPAWRGFGAERDRHPPLRGWIACPLIRSDGSNFGLLQVSDRAEGEFDAADEAALAQLAHLVSIAAENARLLDVQKESAARAEAAAAAANAARDDLEGILSTTSDGMCVLDRAFRFRYVNAAASRFFEVPREELHGRPLWDVLTTAREPELHSVLQAALTEGRNGQLELQEDEGGRWLDMRCFPHADGVALYFQDTSERRRAEQQLVQSQKMDAVGQLTGGVAHDFNNLLTVIIGHAEMLAVDPAVPHRQQIWARHIAEAAERGERLVSHLMAFSRQQPLRPEAVDVGERLSTLLPLIRRTISETIQVELAERSGPGQSSPGRPVARVDGAQLDAAVLNLAINARDAMPQGGLLRIDVDQLRVDPGDAGELRPGRYVRITVSDTGTGIAPDHLGRVFEPFFTTKEAGRGSGLGLSMVYGFVKQSGGYVSIYSEPGQGTAVKILLPATAAGQEAALEPDRDASPPPGAGERILVVEDDPLVREQAAAVIRAIGMEPILATDASAALALLRAEGPFDLLFTDVVMPGPMNGPQLARAAQEIQPGLGVVYTSGYDESALTHDGRLDDGVVLVGKPYRRADLARAFWEVLQATGAARG